MSAPVVKHARYCRRQLFTIINNVTVFNVFPFARGKPGTFSVTYKIYINLNETECTLTYTFALIYLRENLRTAFVTKIIFRTAKIPSITKYQFDLIE